ncbi:aminoacyl--tRNA ligase-related protein [Streptomyces sp. NBC_00582]|uniref:aminoacyl--tRNA ligase-related protein n=1 Tax=Streptomyces sp. NBC_00582 TaxID=2975783 RepID=UPI0010627F4D|nr:aminoacyl--tRNA ligase-related protein [Streptomyces sp. NBC_00582]WUB59226.1 His/Gly/Thr/Pro-type tRNA ligase C-terminal domain-containing protein [Streptomyces sp. NBC_00582]
MTVAPIASHRLAGREHDLFLLSPEVGRGLVVWSPAGARLRHALEEFWRDVHQAHGYDVVMTPHLGRADLWGDSRQLDFHRETMFPEFDVEGTPYVVKGANCPLHMQVFRSRTRSHRDLPVRLAEISTLYRQAPAGSLKGLRYTRTISQDDSHIFCREQDVVEEIVRYFDLVRRLLRAFGFEDLRPYLGTRDDRSVPGDELWERATGHLLDGLREAGLEYRHAPGAATYYAPRVGIDVIDASGTAWPLPDLQVDYHLPRLCGVEYTGADGRRTHPVVLHRTLLGSVERFVAALLEHHGPTGLPDWLKPVHVRVLPVREEDETTAHALAESLRLEGVRVALDDRRTGLGARSAKARADGVPLVVAVGRDEARTGRYHSRDLTGRTTDVDYPGLVGLARRTAARPDPSLSAVRPLAVFPPTP